MKMVVLVFAIAACGNGGSGPPPPETTKPAPSPFGSGAAHAAVDPWNECAGCHGPEGHGDGPMAASLVAKPRDFSDPAWQAKTDDATIAKAIVGGGPAVGLTNAMPAHAALSADQVTALVAKIRGLQR